MAPRTGWYTLGTWEAPGSAPTLLEPRGKMDSVPFVRMEGNWVLHLGFGTLFTLRFGLVPTIMIRSGSLFIHKLVTNLFPHFIQHIHFELKYQYSVIQDLHLT